MKNCIICSAKIDYLNNGTLFTGCRNGCTIKDDYMDNPNIIIRFNKHLSVMWWTAPHKHYCYINSIKIPWIDIPSAENKEKFIHKIKTLITFS